MNPYDVRALTGSFAPTNGKGTIRSVNTGDDDNVVIAWSGGGKSLAGTRLYVSGGGHMDSSNNGLYQFEFAGTNAPTGWTELAPNTNSESGPVSAHSIDGVIHAHHNNYLYRFGGSSYPSGSWTSEAWKNNLATGAWTRLPNFPGAITNVWVVAIYDPVTGKILVGNATVDEAFFFRTSNDTWSAGKTLNDPLWMTAAWDSTRGRAISISTEGGSAKTRIYTINWSNETITDTNFSFSVPTSGSPALFYDADRDVYWMFGGTSGAGWSNIYEINAANLSLIATHALSAPIPGTTAGGTYGRFVFLREWRAIGTVNASDAPAYIIKLPAATVATRVPGSPVALTAN